MAESTKPTNITEMEETKGGRSFFSLLEALKTLLEKIKELLHSDKPRKKTQIEILQQMQEQLEATTEIMEEMAESNKLLKSILMDDDLSKSLVEKSNQLKMMIDGIDLEDDEQMKGLIDGLGIYNKDVLDKIRDISIDIANNKDLEDKEIALCKSGDMLVVGIEGINEYGAKVVKPVLCYDGNYDKVEPIPEFDEKQLGLDEIAESEYATTFFRELSGGNIEIKNIVDYKKYAEEYNKHYEGTNISCEYGEADGKPCLVFSNGNATLTMIARMDESNGLATEQLESIIFEKDGEKVDIMQTSYDDVQFALINDKDCRELCLATPCKDLVKETEKSMEEKINDLENEKSVPASEERNENYGGNWGDIKNRALAQATRYAELCSVAYDRGYEVIDATNDDSLDYSAKTVMKDEKGSVEEEIYFFDHDIEREGKVIRMDEKTGTLALTKDGTDITKNICEEMTKIEIAEGFRNITAEPLHDNSDIPMEQTALKDATSRKEAMEVIRNIMHYDVDNKLQEVPTLPEIVDVDDRVTTPVIMEIKYGDDIMQIFSEDVAVTRDGKTEVCRIGDRPFLAIDTEGNDVTDKLIEKSNKQIEAVAKKEKSAEKTDKPKNKGQEH